MDLHYEFTLEDLRALLGWHRTPERTRQQALHRWAGSAWLALMGASLAIGLRAPALGWLAVAAVPLLFWWRYPLEAERRARRHAEQQLRDADRQGRLGPCTLQVSAQGLVLHAPAGARAYAWEQVQEVVTTDTLLLLVTGRDDVLALPRRAVPAGAPLEQYLARVRSHVA